MIKTGDLRETSKGDFDRTKKAEYFDEDGYAVADAGNKDKLRKPKRIEHKSTEGQPTEQSS